MARAEVTHVKEGRVFVGIIQPLEDRDVVIELHRDEQKSRPTDVRFMILSREEFRQVIADWTEFDRGLKR